MTGYARFRVFSILFGIVYCLCFYYNWAVFRYYPLLEGFRLQSQPASTAGPAILWYAWLAQAFVITAGLTLLVPNKLAARVSPTVVWVMPLATVVGILVYEQRWFW